MSAAQIQAQLDQLSNAETAWEQLGAQLGGAGTASIKAERLKLQRELKVLHHIEALSAADAHAVPSLMKPLAKISSGSVEPHFLRVAKDCLKKPETDKLLAILRHWPRNLKFSPDFIDEQDVERLATHSTNPKIVTGIDFFQEVVDIYKERGTPLSSSLLPNIDKAGDNSVRTRLRKYAMGVSPDISQFLDCLTSTAPRNSDEELQELWPHVLPCLTLNARAGMSSTCTSIGHLLEKLKDRPGLSGLSNEVIALVVSRPKPALQEICQSLLFSYCLEGEQAQWDMLVACTQKLSTIASAEENLLNTQEIEQYLPIFLGDHKERALPAYSLLMRHGWKPPACIAKAGSEALLDLVNFHHAKQQLRPVVEPEAIELGIDLV